MKPKTELSDGEWTLMKVLWDKNPLTIAQITNALKDVTGWGKHTVITMLGRLENKGAVEVGSNGKAKLYTPLLDREDTARRETDRFLDKVFSGRVGVMLNTMLDSRSLSQDEFDELADILEKAREERRESGDQSPD